MATEPRQHLPDRRFILVDALRAGWPRFPGDLALLRMGRDHYVMFAAEDLASTAKHSLVEHLGHLLSARNCALAGPAT
ncbi:hypothetical protein [Phenylobacterium sp.]|uniref:hypothetical protein n=1 Tax=Phenylobacterium sp. TaxID=1871053 RepID=UPI002E367E84|nr:hypothetical protein [Phenylobacterium sp.]HEX4712014.1 hypothetical protein [Phenylobacterium sp.]